MVASGQISRARIDESYKRIMTLKKKLNNYDTNAYQAEVARLQNELASANEQLVAAKKLADENAATSGKKKKKKKSKS